MELKKKNYNFIVNAATDGDAATKELASLFCISKVGQCLYRISNPALICALTKSGSCRFSDAFLLGPSERNRNLSWFIAKLIQHEYN